MDFFNYLIPLSNVPQVFIINLSGVNYSLTSKWNDMAQSWYLDIADSAQNPIAVGIPFVTGVNILGQLSYLGIGGELFVFTTGDPDSVPTLDNLGSESNLYFQSTVANNGG